VAVFGNQFFSDSLLRAQIRLHKGEALRKRLIQESVQAILSAYAEQGYLDAAVTPNVQVNSEAHLALVDFLITEGYQFRVDSIRITGKDKTKRHVVTRELLFKPAQIIKYSRVLKSQRQLYLTGLFESAFIRPVPASSGDTLAKDILVELKERPSSEFGVMLGYGSLEKIRGQIELTTNNLSGTARQAGIVLEANFIKQGTSVSFSDPWTFGTRWKTDIGLYFEMRQEPGYDQRLLGARLTVGRRLGLHTNLAVSFRAENTDLSHIEVYNDIGEIDPRIRTLSLSLTRDTRDNLFNARSGEYFEWTNELAGGFLSGTNTFARSIARLKLFRPWGRETVIASAIDIGLMGHLGEEEEIPLSERFYTGGPTSLRGFGYQMAGPTDIDGTPQGGNFKIVWNAVEIRRTIYKAFGLAGFVDVGNVWNEIATFRIDNLRYTAGIGLRVGSPLGLLRLDYGVNLDRRGDEPRTRLFLGIGQAI
jgi:outer membrane protein insertion porin family